MVSETEYRTALREMTREVRIAFLYMDSKLNELGQVNVHLSLKEKQDLLNQITRFNQQVKDIEEKLNSRLDQIEKSRHVWEESAKKNREEFSRKLKELFDLLKQFRIDGRLIVPPEYCEVGEQ